MEKPRNASKRQMEDGQYKAQRDGKFNRSDKNIVSNSRGNQISH